VIQRVKVVFTKRLEKFPPQGGPTVAVLPPDFHIVMLDEARNQILWSPTACAFLVGCLTTLSVARLHSDEWMN
jgi:hypothetical protein